MAEPVESIDELRRSGYRRIDELVGNDDEERLVTDYRPGAQDRMADSQRLGLAHELEAHVLRKKPPQLGEQLVAVVKRKCALELVGLVEMILDGALAAVGDENELPDAGAYHLLDRIVDQRLVDDG